MGQMGGGGGRGSLVKRFPRKMMAAWVDLSRRAVSEKEVRMRQFKLDV